MINDLKLKNIISNKGATLDGNGQDLKASRGFMVSIIGTEVKTDANGLKKALDKKIEEIKGQKGLFCGAWLDGDTWYIDTSILIQDKKQAIKIGLQNNQLAIYDLKNNDSIRLNYCYYTLYKVIKDDVGTIKDLKLINQYDDEQEGHNVKMLENMQKITGFKISYKTLKNTTYNGNVKLDDIKRTFHDLIIIKDFAPVQDII